MEFYIILGITVVGMIGSFIFGYKHALGVYSKRLIKDFDFGDVVVNVSSVEDDTISISFSRNPREMFDKNYILLNVKIRE